MDVDIKTGPIEHIETGTLIVPFFADKENTTAAFKQLDALFDGSLSHAVEEDDDFHKNKRSFMTLSLGKVHAKRIALVSLGEVKDVTTEKLRGLAAKYVKGLSSYKEKNCTILSPCYGLQNVVADEVYYALTEGAVLASYTYDLYKTKEKDKNKKIQHVSFYLDEHEDAKAIQNSIERAALICLHSNLVKDLANGPPNIVTPTYLVQTAKKIAKECKLRLKVLDKHSMKKENMNCLLAVAQGSAEPPALIILEYRGVKGKQPVAIVGKGVTFDAGGINLKPSGYIETMKEDMTGAAVVLNAIRAAALLKLPINLVCVVPTVENMPGGKATRPSDVVVASNGKTVEIMNTDAEGRLILADALHYATKYKPSAIIDFATLTGASRVALGKAVTPIMGTDPAIVDDIILAGKDTHERCWELPLFDDYSDAIKGDVADIKNIGGPKGEAGTIAAAVFLKEFVGDYPWVHFDIGGSSWNDGANGYYQKGSSGVGLRVLLRYLEKVSEEKE
jgi:leucyl aminopeptidase